MKRKIGIVDYIIWGIFCVFGGFAGYLIGGAMISGGRDFIKVCEAFSKEMDNPFSFDYWNDYSVPWILAGVITTGFIIAIIQLNKKNFMFGKEYGTAKWADVKSLNKVTDNAFNKKDKNASEHQLTIEQKRFLRKPKKITINTYNMRLSKNLYLSLDTRYTDLNNNILVVGGSGAGKSFRFVKPNFMTLSSTFVSTDPKGELLRDTAGFFKHFGYVIKVMDLRNADGLRRSTRYNPFKYLKADLDVLKLISNIISNTTEKFAAKGEPFWEKAEGMFLQAVFFYVWKVGVWCEKTNRNEHNMWAVMQIVNKIVIEEDASGNRVPCVVDRWFKALEEKEPNHKAVTFYNNSMSGAADTVRSIVIQAKSRLAPLDNDELLDFFWDDEMGIENLGQEKTAMYCVIPDDDSTYNFVVGIYYTQMFQICYHIADNMYGGALPVHVRIMFDEFANVALPNDFMKILSTMRSRNMSATIIIQTMQQIKALFEKEWQNICGNTDTFVYLGGNEPDTHKYVSEQLGKATIDKRSTSESRGKSGSTSHSDDGTGRELLFADEVRKLNRKKCIVMINGKDPVLDDKVQSNFEPLWKTMRKTRKKYIFDARLERHKKKVLKEKGIVSESEVAMMKIRDKQNKEKYDYEKMIAKEIDMKYEETFTPEVVEVDLTDIFAFADMSQAEIDQVMHGKIKKLTNDDIEKNAQEEEERLKGRMAAEDAELEEEEKNTIHIDRFQTAEEAETFMLLTNSGFEPVQIKIILRLVTEVNYGTPEKIASLFTTDYTTEQIEMLVDTLVNTCKESA